MCVVQSGQDDGGEKFGVGGSLCEKSLGDNSVAETPCLVYGEPPYRLAEEKGIHGGYPLGGR